MASLRIPERHRVGLAKLRQLSNDDIEAITSALRQHPVALKSGSHLMPVLAPVLSKIPAADVEKISDTLASLYFVQADADVPLTKFAADVCGALRDSGETFTDEEFERYVDRVGKLLSVDLLSIVSKAVSLQADHENIFHEAKILTDVRPVFGIDVDDPPKGFVVTHILKCEYHDTGRAHRNFYVALDHEDLAALKAAIERAQRKAISIKSLMDKAGIRNLLEK